MDILFNECSEQNKKLKGENENLSIKLGNCKNREEYLQSVTESVSNYQFKIEESK